MKPSSIAWSGANKPDHGYKTETIETHCAICAASINEGVPISQLETPTTSSHADIFKHGTKYSCHACAWLFNSGKGKPGNFVSTPQKTEYAVISLESVVEDKRPWIDILPELAMLPPDTPVTGVMTTDVKPRLWHKCQSATIVNFGLYIHVMDYDISEWRYFDLSLCLKAINDIIKVLSAGFSKQSVYFGLMRDFNRMVKNPEQTIQFEALLSTHRDKPYFLPALIAAGVKKEKKISGK